jgi:3-phenylpropionate/trans-cinnamate dioxygenase ferredoxin reductase component
VIAVSGVLIVGAGLAGLHVAETLRAEGYEGAVTIVGEEPVPPYERPALSKEFLSGSRSAGALQLRSGTDLAGRGIDLLLGSRVERVEGREAIVAGRRLGWEHLVLATGARARRPSSTAWPREALVLRTIDDAHALRRRLVAGARLTVVGAGLVGAEVASTALSLGCHVSVVDPGAGPLAGTVGAPVAALLADRWRAQGVSAHFGTAVAVAEERELLLESGARLGFDVLLLAIGAEPVGELLGDPGAVPTDACGRTRREHVYACGDVARFAGRPGGHWTAAAGQAAAVASAILGSPVPYDDPGFFWSDQFGLRLQMVGAAAGAVSTELAGGRDSFSARYFDRGARMVGVLLANRPHEVGAARRELRAAA